MKCLIVLGFLLQFTERNRLLQMEIQRALPFSVEYLSEGLPISTSRLSAWSEAGWIRRSEGLNPFRSCFSQIILLGPFYDDTLSKGIQQTNFHRRNVYILQKERHKEYLCFEHVHIFGHFPCNSTLPCFPRAISKAKYSNYRRDCQVPGSSVSTYCVSMLAEVSLMSSERFWGGWN